ncbi:tol-pal system YbgF family protein [Spirochaetota bacterium]
MKKLKYISSNIHFIITLICLPTFFSCYTTLPVDKPFITVDPLLILKKGSLSVVKPDGKLVSYHERRKEIPCLFETPMTVLSHKNSFFDMYFIKALVIRGKPDTRLSVKYSTYSLNNAYKNINISLEAGTVLIDTVEYNENDQLIIYTGDFVLHLKGYSGMISSYTERGKAHTLLYTQKGKAIVFNRDNLRAVVTSVGRSKTVLYKNKDPHIERAFTAREKVLLDEIASLKTVVPKKTVTLSLHTSLLYRAVFLENNRDHRKAIGVYRSILPYFKNTKDIAHINYRLASILHYKLYDYREAFDHYRNAIFMGDTVYSSEACIGLYYLLVKLDYEKIGEMYLRKAIKEYPGTPAALRAQRILKI